MQTQSQFEQLCVEIQRLQADLERSQVQLRQTQRDLQASEAQLRQIKAGLGQLQQPTDLDDISFPTGDYVSPGLHKVKLDRCFPNMIIGEPAKQPWVFLRREIPHNWYVDARHPEVGFINRDEAHILYNSALKFAGKRGLEIGCWMGWSACHIASAGVELDVIDPMLEQSEFYESVSDSIETAGLQNSVRLISGSSPTAVENLATQDNRKWSFFFIDGNHDAPHPLNDAKTCEPFAEDNAMMMFHDLVFPSVAAGLEYLSRKGWNVMLYQTMQIMGVAWRGNVEPVLHQPDPKIYWQLPQHLQHYAGNVGHASEDVELIEQAVKRLQTEVDYLRDQLQFSRDQTEQAENNRQSIEAQLLNTQDKLTQAQAQSKHTQDELTQHQLLLTQTQSELERSQTLLTQKQTALAQTQSELSYAQEHFSQAKTQLTQTETECKQIQHELLSLQPQLTHVQAELSSSQAQLHGQQAKFQSLQIEFEQQGWQVHQSQDQVEQLQAKITAMESSKFWQIRQGWMRLKRSLGLKADP